MCCCRQSNNHYSILTDVIDIAECMRSIGVIEFLSFNLVTSSYFLREKHSDPQNILAWFSHGIHQYLKI